jgi:uncharacterized protein YpmB
MDPAQLIAAIGALWLAIQGLSALVYRELKAQVAECKARNATLEADAKAAVQAKDAEIAEWKRLLLESHVRETPKR